MITKLRIKNLKCLQDTGDLDIRPLTFLVGPNSSGKSTLLQMLLMLRQTVDSTDIENPLVTNDGWVQMGAYPDFIFKGETRRCLEVGIEFEEINPTQSLETKYQRISISVVFGYNPETTQIQLEEREIRLGTEEHQRIVRDEETKEYQLIAEKKTSGSSGRLLLSGVRPNKFYDFAFTLRPGETRKDLPDLGQFGISIPFAQFIIKNEFQKLFYLGPLRESPQRFYVVSGQAPQDVGARGERAADVLWFSHRSRKKGACDVEEKVENWFNQFHIAKKVKLEKDTRESYFQIIITDPATGVETNLADIGFGASQTLPIIIESFYAPPGSAILIEQPEIHLHPAAQSILGDLFIEAAIKQKDRRTFIIETHSEHILARVRRRIAEERLSKDQVAIYYFEPTSEGTRIQEVTLNEQGQYESFPDGFFEEDVMEAFEHLKALRLTAAQ